MNKQYKIIILTLFAMLLTGVVAQAGIVVIANPGVSETTISQGTIQKMFLGKNDSWGDGSPVQVAMLVKGDLSEAFLKAFVKKSPNQFKTFWKKAVFSGVGAPPVEFKTEAEMVKFVAETAGAIGYVSDAAATEGVKAIGIE